MSDEDYRGRRVLVVGLGRSGIAAARYLLRKGARVRTAETSRAARAREEVRELERGGVELVLGPHPSGLAADVDLVVSSPGVPAGALPLREARAGGTPVWAELELGFRETPGLLVAVTGTKGKSTTATLLAEFLRQSGRSVLLGGNIGRPLIGLADSARPDSVLVVEVSSFQLEGTEHFHPRVAVLLDVTPDHLDRHPSFEAYVRMKERIFANQERGDWAVVYGANPLTVDMASKSRSKKIYFSFDCLKGRSPQVFADGPWMVWSEDGESRPLARWEGLSLRGRHNVENVLAAATAATLLDVEPGAIEQVVTQFSGLPHALEKIAELNRVAFYNDSKATNAAATRAALESFDGGVFLILGGRFKGTDLGSLRAVLAPKVKRILAIGENRDRIAALLGDVVPVVVCPGLEDAVKTAFAQASPGDTVLLSPGGASFDMFADYAERGQRFREVVEALTRVAERGDEEESGEEESRG